MPRSHFVISPYLRPAFDAAGSMLSRPPTLHRESAIISRRQLAAASARWMLARQPLRRHYLKTFIFQLILSIRLDTAILSSPASLSIRSMPLIVRTLLF